MSLEKETKAASLDEKAKALANEPDEESKIAKMLNHMPKWRYYSLIVLSIFWTIFQIYIKMVRPLDPWFQLPLHMCLALVVVWLFNPMVEKSKSHNKLWWIYDAFLIGSSVFICWSFLSRSAELNYRIFNVDVMTTLDVITAVLLVINVMEAVRRVVSMSLFWVICFFLAYAWFGQYIPGLFRFAGLSFPKLMEILMYGENGIFGSPLVTSLNTLFYFLVFGTFFSNCGGGEVLIDGGMKLSDKTVGGPAKAAVISSGLLGMISGSAIANVSTTGVLTIPLMKKTGYSPEEAAAVESVASTGGQIMPPIMGAGAFIMAEIIGIQYVKVAAAAVLPAIAYFLAVFILVHMIAKKKGIGKDSGVHYEGKPILPRVYRLLPIIALVVLIIMGYSLPRSAMYCTVFAIIIAQLSADTRMSFKKLLQTLMEGVRQAANIAIPTAACGIMIGIVVNSGVAVKIAKLIGNSGESGLFLALMIAAIGCLLLGMALPTVAAYLIANTLFCSAIQGLGISALVANMFIFYFGVVAQITPPVCLASFTAAGIAGASAWKTGWKAFSFAITAFIVPFAFVYRPAILLEGAITEILIAYGVVIIATYLLACGIAGYLMRPIRQWERIACYVIAFVFIMPGSMSDIIGLVGCAVICAYCFMTAKAQKVKAETA
ncbi:MAG: TRAP transporter fused permease subunit [Eubacteriales bacterium]|nr:TRAP transporter fused permease subunit [Eubacteriales bacterium]